jgi:hypothetical protein
MQKKMSFLKTLVSCTTLTEAELDTKFSNMFNHLLANSDNFALYFYQQWVVGEFKEWQIFVQVPE